MFDSYGSAAVRKLEVPYEILMFCVDCSASMRQRTEFWEINEIEEEASSVLQPTVEGEYFANARFEDVKKSSVSMRVSLTWLPSSRPHQNLNAKMLQHVFLAYSTPSLSTNGHTR